jgi:hypothetical protein
MRIHFFAIWLLSLSLVNGCTHRHPEDADAVYQADLPPVQVRTAFRKEFPDDHLTHLEKKILPDGSVRWRAEYSRNNGSSGVAEFDADGNLLSQP